MSNPDATTYRLKSSTMVHMPGLIAWAINGYAFDKDREQILKVFTTSFPTVPETFFRQLFSKAVPYSVDGDTVVFTGVPTSEYQRFNNLCEGDTLERFEWFELVACRNDESEGCVVQCEAGWDEFWGIYGRANEGTEDQPEYLATAIHDALTPLEAVQIARQIALETGKGFVAGDIHFGHFPHRDGKVVPVAEFTELAEDLTFAIHEDIEGTIAEEDQRDGDFDNHPLADLREAFVQFSDYSGSDQRDPYQPLTEQKEGGQAQ